MRKSWTTMCLAVGCVMAMGLAQAPSPSQPRGSSATVRLIVNGCVELAAPRATGTAGTTDPSLSEAHLLLTDAVPTKSGLAEAAGPTHPNPVAAKTFRLEGRADALTLHIGHWVQIAGTVEGSDNVTPSVSVPPPGPASAALAPKLKVESIQMVEAMCPGNVVRK